MTAPEAVQLDADRLIGDVKVLAKAQGDAEIRWQARFFRERWPNFFPRPGMPTHRYSGTHELIHCYRGGVPNNYYRQLLTDVLGETTLWILDRLCQAIGGPDPNDTPEDRRRGRPEQRIHIEALSFLESVDMHAPQTSH